MDTNDIDNILVKLPMCGVIPNYKKVVPILHNMYVTHISPGAMFISYYYYQRASIKVDPSEITADIGKQAHWLSKNVPSVSKMAKVTRTARNILEHNDAFTMEFFRSLVKHTFAFNELYPDVLTQTLTGNLHHVAITIAGMNHDLNIPVDIGDLYCPLCGRGEFRLKKQLKQIAPEADDRSNTLSYYKNSGVKLAGLRIKALDGMFKDECGYFSSWNGGNAIVVLDTQGRKSLNLIRKVEILDTESPMVAESQLEHLSHNIMRH